MSLNWNFQRGGGFKPKKPSMGGVWIFSGQQIVHVAHLIKEKVNCVSVKLEGQSLEK